MRTTFLSVVAIAWLSTAAIASAETMTFSAPLKGADEVPANATSGTGEVTTTLDTKTGLFTYKATYSGLTGPAVAAHFHGPAMAGANAPPVIPMTTLSSPISGSATLTAPQIADLEAGKWYFNVHTAAHPAGEVRGQLQMTMK
jgi:hypothetical protein